MGEDGRKGRKWGRVVVGSGEGGREGVGREGKWGRVVER